MGGRGQAHPVMTGRAFFVVCGCGQRIVRLVGLPALLLEGIIIPWREQYMSGTKQLVQKGQNGKPDIFVDPPSIRVVLKEFNTYLPKLKQQIADYKKDINTGYKWPDFGVMTFIPETGQIPGHYEDMRKKNSEYLDGLLGNLNMLGAALEAAHQYYDLLDGREPQPTFIPV